jgi:hypothetical protein
MPVASLTSYWIDGPDDHGPLGYGVTAFSPEDAWAIIADAGYTLPEEKKSLTLRSVRSVDDVAVRYVSDHSGPIVMRGLWYPFNRLGTTREKEPIQPPQTTTGISAPDRV